MHVYLAVITWQRCAGWSYRFIQGDTGPRASARVTLSSGEPIWPGPDFTNTLKPMISNESTMVLKSDNSVEVYVHISQGEPLCIKYTVLRWQLSFLLWTRTWKVSNWVEFRLNDFVQVGNSGRKGKQINITRPSWSVWHL